MNTKILIGIIITVIILISGIFIFWYIPTHKCPESCDDKDICTEDFCSKETNYKCSRSIIQNCCGNEICETEESYEICPADCPNCDDSNKCTKDSYDYHEQKCLNTPILTVICCGNTICETGETYGSCPRDCPNCDDDNKCTKDSYDYHQQKCLNEILIPCCGNGICDKGAEAYLSCPKDCPNCDDKNKLTTDSFNYTTQKCENPVTHYFLDDFESGTENWAFSDENGDPVVWSTIVESSNTVLRGTGYWGFLQGKEWANYIFKSKFKIIKESVNGGMHFNYRIGSGARSSERYMVGISSHALNLTKSFGGKFFNLVESQALNLGKEWHTIEIKGYNDIFNIYIDNKLFIKFKDAANPILSGGIAFEIFEGSEFLIDDVEIKIIAEKDIIYP